MKGFRTTEIATRSGRMRRSLASAFRNNHTELSRALFAAVRDGQCATWQYEQSFDQVEEWGRSNISTAVELLAAWYETHDLMFRELFAGWVHSRLVHDLSDYGPPADYKPGQAVEVVRTLWTDIVKPHVSAETVAILTADLQDISAFLSKEPVKQLRVLFIGDCIQFEVMTALLTPCVEAQIAIKPTLIVERVQPVLRNKLRTLRPEEFDVVFFSPFSHTFVPEYEMLLRPGSTFWRREHKRHYVDAMLKEVRATIDTLTDHFQCPVYTHNTAGTTQLFGSVTGIVKSVLSHRSRAEAKQLINEGITKVIDEPDAQSRVLLLDEASLCMGTSAWNLGRVRLNSHAFHPTQLGVELGRGPYFEASYVAAYLANKKVVICDLDNTLWDGVIGEGGVRHYTERQTVLKRLKEKGVLLSINSKNDIRNIHWTGAVLQEQDFVAARINWDPKATNIGTIRDLLNLKVKDFVFIDDRDDELERVKNAFPEILTLHAHDPATWKRLSHWERVLALTPSSDRTKVYHERAQRAQFVSGVQSTVEDEATALAALQIEVVIQEVNASGLKRVVELVNRTNQFNLCGSRTSSRELEEGLGTRHTIVTAEARDKFGSMGVVAAMQCVWGPNRTEVPLFVLSCRAFGFGIEYALLNTLKRLAPGEHALIGHYKETQFNQPCRDLYPKSGMTWDGSAWVGTVGQLPPDPVWLRIEHKMLSINSRGAAAL